LQGEKKRALAVGLVQGILARGMPGNPREKKKEIQAMKTLKNWLLYRNCWIEKNLGGTSKMQNKGDGGKGSNQRKLHPADLGPGGGNPKFGYAGGSKKN